MNNKIDPICGMKGGIAKHGHFFCSEHCIEVFEKQKGIKSDMNKKLLGALGVLSALALVVVLQTTGFMVLFMGLFFIIVSILKFVDWKGFVDRFVKYDLLAKNSRLYAYAYPVIELGLGFSFAFAWNVVAAAWVTLVVMSLGAIGVGQNLLSKNPVKCACLGAKIKVPLTKFTFFEDVLMAVMALMILFL